MNYDIPVRVWNQRCGNTPEKVGSIAFYSSILTQINRVQEEINEVVEAVQAKDLGEVISEMADLQYVVSGLKYLIGGQHTKAFTDIVVNNDLKVTKDNVLVYKWYDYHIAKGNDVRVESTEIAGVTWYCVKDNVENKVKKPPMLPKPDLSKYAPEPEPVYYMVLESLEKADNLTKDVKEVLQEVECEIVGTSVFDAVEFETLLKGQLEKCEGVLIEVTNGVVAKLELVGVPDGMMLAELEDDEDAGTD